MASAAFVDFTDPTNFGGKLNIYTCDKCHSHIVTRDVDEGTTPMFLPSSEYCPIRCKAPAHMTSSMYRVWDQSMRENYQWYRPSAIEVVPKAYRSRVEQGGLLLRSIA